MAYTTVHLKYYSITFLLLVSLFLGSCGVTSQFNEGKAYSTRTEASTGSSKYVSEEGVASWYGPNFHGKLTANGEKYDMYKLTAAHRTLPFNTIVQVENLDNGQTVLVRINDRGPFAKNRIIDLSKKAAEEINMIGPGTARVKLFIPAQDLANSKTTDLKTATYTVQLGSFEYKQQAIKRSKQIKGSRVEKIKLNNNTVYRVYYGTYLDRDEATNKRDQLKRQGFYGYVKQIEN